MTIAEEWDKVHELWEQNANIWREDKGRTFCVAKDYCTQVADGRGLSWEEDFANVMAHTSATASIRSET